MYKALKFVPLFEGLSDHACDIIAGCMATKSYGKDVVVIHQGDETHSLYIIDSGSVKVYLCGDDGREVVLTIQGSGEYFGELSLLDGAPRSASVMTIEPSKFFVISEVCFKECLRDHPDIGFVVLRDLARRVRRLTENVGLLALKDVYGRIAKTLPALAVLKDGRQVIPQRLTHQDIASRVGSSREMVTRIMRDLIDGGYIQILDRHIVINKPLPSHW